MWYFVAYEHQDNFFACAFRADEKRKNVLQSRCGKKKAGESAEPCAFVAKAEIQLLQEYTPKIGRKPANMVDLTQIMDVPKNSTRISDLRNINFTNVVKRKNNKTKYTNIGEDGKEKKPLTKSKRRKLLNTKARESVAKHQASRPLEPKLDPKAAAKLVQYGKSVKEVADIYEVHTDTVITVTKNYLEEIGADTTRIEAFKNSRADVFAEIQRRLLAAITDEKLDKATLRDILSGVGILYDKERLERGKSSNNQGIIVNFLAHTRKSPLDMD